MMNGLAQPGPAVVTEALSENKKPPSPAETTKFLKHLLSEPDGNNALTVDWHIKTTVTVGSRATKNAPPFCPDRVTEANGRNRDKWQKS